MTLPHISMAFNNLGVFFAYAACQSGSALFHHSENHAKGAATAYNAPGYMVLGKEQW